jgi:hypothetical protein
MQSICEGSVIEFKWSVITPTMGKGRGRVSEEENGVVEKIGTESRGGDSARNKRQRQCK